jgi:hypothetical protein
MRPNARLVLVAPDRTDSPLLRKGRAKREPRPIVGMKLELEENLNKARDAITELDGILSGNN